MAHFAELDNNNKVLRVVIVPNGDIIDSNGQENEEIGILKCKDIYGENTHWVQTSYNGNFRKCYAGEGYDYDQVKDTFIPIKPYPSWVFDEVSWSWKPPIDPPIYDPSGPNYQWDEETSSWIANYG